MAKKPKKQPEEHVWRIIEIRKKGYYIGSVTAATADEAIALAIEEFGLNPQRAKRLVAERVS